MNNFFLNAIALLALAPLAWADRYDDVVNNSARPAADVQRDDLREPATVLRKIGVEPGSRILDVGAGGGYYTELLAGLVGSEGEVLLQNPAELHKLFPTIKESLEGKRLADKRLPNVTLLDDEVIALSLKDNSVDMVFIHLFYHDLFWIHADQADVFNAEMKRVLKPGGRLVIIDHNAPAESGVTHALSRQGGTHRIEAAYVAQSLEKLGFKLSLDSGLLHNHNDDRSQAFFAESLRGKKTDRFFHIYTK